MNRFHQEAICEGLRLFNRCSRERVAELARMPAESWRIAGRFATAEFSGQTPGILAAGNLHSHKF
jgi:hypothetical protein